MRYCKKCGSPLSENGSCPICKKKKRQNTVILSLIFIILTIVAVASVYESYRYKDMYVSAAHQLSRMQDNNSKSKANVSAEETSQTESTSSAAEKDDGSETTPYHPSTYTVQASDDTGVKLCMHIYGQYTPALWNKLCRANGKSGSDFVVGEELTVP